MSLSDFTTWIARNSFWVAIAIVIGFVFYFFIKFISKAKKEIQKKESSSPPEDNPIKRTARGFKELYKSISESDYVKSIQEDQKTADPYAFASQELFTDAERVSKGKKKKVVDPFATDLSNFGGTDL